MYDSQIAIPPKMRKKATPKIKVSHSKRRCRVQMLDKALSLNFLFADYNKNNVHF